MYKVKPYIFTRFAKGGNFVRDLYKNCNAVIEKALITQYNHMVADNYAICLIWRKLAGSEHGKLYELNVLQKALFKTPLPKSYADLDYTLKQILQIILEEYFKDSNSCGCDLDCGCTEFQGKVWLRLIKDGIIKRLPSDLPQ